MPQRTWKSKKRLTELAQANFKEGDKFITLTFADQENIDIGNLDDAHKAFQLFIRRLARAYKTFKYIAVPEYQEKRGAVHYHVICNLGYIKKQKLADIWNQGFVKINRINTTKEVTTYISKYLTKNAEDVRFLKRRKFYCSNNLIRPEKLGFITARSYLSRIRSAKIAPVAWETYSSPYNGLITTEKYNLADLDKKKK